MPINPRKTKPVPPNNRAPTARLSCANSTVTIGALLTVNGSASSDPDGTLKRWTLTWGDGGTISGNGQPSLLSHLYEAVGAYEVTLLVVDKKNVSATKTIPVAVVAVQIPRAVLTLTSTGTSTDDSWTLSTAGTLDPDGTIVSGTLDWDDGTVISITGAPQASYSHTYADADTYTVVLTVTDNDGQTASTTYVLVVAEPDAEDPPPDQGPVAVLTYVSGSLITQPYTVSTVGSYDPIPGRILQGGSITFGDATAPVTWTAAPAATYSHTYTVAGTYTITLTITNSDGIDAIATRQAIVVAVPLANQPPVASLTLLSGYYAGNTFQVSTVGSYDPEGALASFVLNWGDGTIITGSGNPDPTYAHVFSTAQSRTVTLTVVDGDDVSATATITIAVQSTLSTVLQPADFTFDGFYRIPGFLPYQMITASRVVAGQRRIFGVSYTDTGNPSLNDYYLYEWAVPSTPPHTSMASAPYLTLVRNWGRLYRDHINTDGNTGNDPFNPGSLYWDEARGGLWWTYSSAYVPFPNSPSLGFTKLNDGAGTFQSYGPWRITNSPFFTTGSMFALPAAWVTAHLTGQTVGFAGGLGSGVAQAPIGTSLLCSALFNPLTTAAQLVGDATVHGNPRFLLYHDIAHRQSRDTNYRQCGWTVPNGSPAQCGTLNTAPVPVFNGNDPANNTSDQAHVCTWFDNGTKRGLLYFGALVRFPLGTAGVAHSWYGTAGVSPGQNQTCCHGQYDPWWIGVTGPGAAFRSPTAWMYDPTTLIPIAQGSVNGWDVNPVTDADRWGERFPTAYPIHVPTDATTKTGVPASNSVGVCAITDTATKKLWLSYRCDSLQIPGFDLYALQQFSVNA